MGTESVAQETYQRGAQTIDKIMQPLLEGIKKLIENARELREDRMAKMVLNWLNKEGEICFNICDDSIANEMKVRLKAENIPYIPYSIADKAKSGVLFRDCDQERVEGLRREILIERGGFLQEVPKSELFCASLNEKIVSLKDLSEEELEVMHNKAWSKGSGFTIVVLCQVLVQVKTELLC